MPKITLTAVRENSFFCSGVLSIGVYTRNKTAILIDSGGDESCAKDVVNALQADGYTVGAIINTHCHPDHCGGNNFFQKKYLDIKIFATHDEKNFIEDPNLAPRCFCGNAAAFLGLKNKYIAPQKSSVVTNTITPYVDQTISILDVPFRIITLPGHTPGSIGIITPDNVLYSGDALFGPETLKKHPMLYYTNIGDTLASLHKLKTIPVDVCVLYHGGIVNDLTELIALHETKILHTKDTVVEHLRSQSLSIDQLTQKIMQQHNIPNSIVSFTLTQTTTRAYLTHLEHEKILQLVVQDGLLQATAL